ncbi:hypothetical protein [Flavobacterium soli]|uniref:hypothetical protein n=1 Tax=Flavobacterium soli TaxID=344881 RepID=UPI00047D9A72|nr:hypothetical protein [Flavobacterium soli]
MFEIPKIISGILTSNPITSILDKFFPDKSDKLKFEFQLRESLTKELDFYLKDVQDARDMQKVALNQTDNFSKRFIYILSLGVLLNSIVAGLMSFFVAFPEANKELVMMYYSFTFIIGGSQVMSFFYGTRQPNQNNNFNTQKNG